MFDRIKLDECVIVIAYKAISVFMCVVTHTLRIFVWKAAYEGDWIMWLSDVLKFYIISSHMPVIWSAAVIFACYSTCLFIACLFMITQSDINFICWLASIWLCYVVLYGQCWTVHLAWAHTSYWIHFDSITKTVTLPRAHIAQRTAGVVTVVAIFYFFRQGIPIVFSVINKNICKFIV